jgi:3-phenylpropionate/cinnamic acid dioxygenase small subunit
VTTLDPMPATSAASAARPGPAALEAEVARFLHHEAELLDARRLHEWLELFESGGRLWVPSRSPTAGSGEPDPTRDVSIIYEDVNHLRLRVARLLSGRELAQDPPSATVRQVTNVLVDAPGEDGIAADEVAVRSVCVLHERWGTRPLLVLPARARHRLRWTGGGPRIVEKRLDLLEPDRYFENLAFLL